MKLLGHGIDIVSLKRPEIRGYKLAKRFMTKNEYNYGLSLNSKTQEQCNYVAGIWSLKEAVIKATNHSYLFSEIEIQILNQKAPVCHLKNHKLLLSLSYEKDYAIASAIAYND